MARRFCLFAATALLSLSPFAAAVSAPAQQTQTVPPDQVHPIRSLPKAPGDTSGDATNSAPSSDVLPPAPTPPAPTPLIGSTPATPTPTPAEPLPPAPLPTPAIAPQQAGTPPVSVTVPAAVDMGPQQMHVARINALTNAPEPQKLTRQPIRPFSAIALQAKVGFAGIGFDVATPLARRFNLRAGASLFSYSASYNADGLIINGDVRFRSGTVGLDIFPFNNGFRITTGLTYYNGNNFNAAILVPGGSTFDLGDGSPSVSSTTDPIHGTAIMSFGNRVAPSFTIGSGNMIPRNGHHLSFPFEIGFQYVKDPTMTLTLAGTACDPDGSGCENIATDPISQQNLHEEQSDINNVLNYLRFYPIVSFGVAWRFGSWH